MLQAKGPVPALSHGSMWHPRLHQQLCCFFKRKPSVDLASLCSWTYCVFQPATSGWGVQGWGATPLCIVALTALLKFMQLHRAEMDARSFVWPGWRTQALNLPFGEPSSPRQHCSRTDSQASRIPAAERKQQQIFQPAYRWSGALLGHRSSDRCCLDRSATAAPDHPCKKLQLPLIAIASVCTSRGMQRRKRGPGDWSVFQFTGGLSLQVNLAEITRSLDELFRSRVILAPGGGERWTAHQSCACPWWGMRSGSNPRCQR